MPLQAAPVLASLAEFIAHTVIPSFVTVLTL